MLVVGLGNTGGDTATTLVGFADKIYLSHRRGGRVVSFCPMRTGSDSKLISHSYPDTMAEYQATNYSLDVEPVLADGSPVDFLHLWPGSLIKPSNNFSNGPTLRLEPIQSSSTQPGNYCQLPLSLPPPQPSLTPL